MDKDERAIAMIGLENGLDSDWDTVVSEIESKLAS